MKIILFIVLLFSVVLGDNECPHDREVLCVDDINKGFAVCEKAAKEGGKDVPADIQCMKYFAQIDQDCWPCICYIAEQQHWKIKGCS